MRAFILPDVYAADAESECSFAFEMQRKQIGAVGFFVMILHIVGSAKAVFRMVHHHQQRTITEDVPVTPCTRPSRYALPGSRVASA
jgi:hypothetical protein